MLFVWLSGSTILEAGAVAWQSFGLHFLSCALLAQALGAGKNPQASPIAGKSFGLAVAAAVLVLPGYGLPLLGLVWAARRLLPIPEGNLLQEFREHVAPEMQKRPSRLADLPLVEHLQVQPLIDQLDSPDIQVRKAVLEAMARRRGRRLINCIRSALNDPNPEIYQYAVAKLGQIQEEHARELTEARIHFSQSREPQTAHALARAYHDYLQSGLLEKTLEPLYLGQLAELYGDILKLAGESESVRLSLARVLMLLGDYPEAQQSCLLALQIQPSSLEARLGLLELHYLRRDWSAFRTELQALEQRTEALPEPLKTRLEWLCRR